MNNKLLNYFHGDELAASVWERKYKFGDEQTPDDSFIRYAKEIAHKKYEQLSWRNIDVEDKLSEYGKERLKRLVKCSEKDLELYYLNFLDYRKILLGGSMLATIGNHESYSSLSNCFVLGRPHDSYEGINQKTMEICAVMSRRGGAGLDLSSLRPDGAKIHNQANMSPGPILFAERYSNITREVAIHGRRGALMLSMSIKHPDSIAFAQSKQDLTKITGANISVILDDDFMLAAQEDRNYYQHFPVDVPIDKFEFDSLSLDELTKVPYTNKHGERKNGYVRRIKAKDAWQKIIHCAWNTAEPGIIFSGNWYAGGTDGVYDRYKAVTTNPCFDKDTLVLTKEGYYKISELVGKKVSVWNGFRWSVVEPKITNHNQEMLKITLSDGSVFRCTKYHNWPKWIGFARNGYEQMTQAQDIKVGDKLTKFKLPIIEGSIEERPEIMYTRGFYCGDGTTNSIDNSNTRDYNNIRLYGEKIELAEFMAGYLSLGSESYQNNIRYIDFKTEEKRISKNWVPNCKYSIKARLDWFAGLIDADGCVCKQEGGGSAQIISTNFEFLNNVRLMLTTLGIKSRLNNMKYDGYYDMPDQKGGLVSVKCKACYRLLINAASMQQLIRMGLVTHRVDFTCFNPNTRDASRFITVDRIEYDGIDENVYCFNEPYAHKAIFNGYLLGQCSEIPMQPYDSCRLASMNLLGFVLSPYTDKAEFDWDLFYKVSYEQLAILDTLVDVEKEYINRIIEKIRKDKDEPQELKNQVIGIWEKIIKEGQDGRRCGAGFTALGDTLAALGLKYDNSKETMEFLEKLFKAKMEAELDASIDLAALYGPFVGFDWELEFKASKVNNIFRTIETNFPEQVERMRKVGRRNVSWSTAAPTGSLSILSQTTSGIEPLFLPYYMRRKKCITADERVDYIDPADGQKFTEFFVLHPQFARWIAVRNNISIETVIEQAKNKELDEIKLNELFKESPWFGCCANDLNWEARVQIQGLVQKYTTHSISSTINLPNDIKPEIVANIYEKSWDEGLKGITVYRDGCRGGILVSTNSKQKDDTEFDENRAPKRPRRLPAKYHTLKSKGKIYSVIIGFYQGKPYEIFITSEEGMPENLDDINDVIDGEIVKDFKNWYNFETDTFILKDLGDVENDEKELSLLLSMSLRHRTPLKFIIKTLQKTQPIAGSFTHKLVKILSKYVNNGESDGEKCPDCGQELIYENGCRHCPHCGWSRC